MKELTKDRIIEAMQGSMTLNDVAQKAGCSVRTVHECLKHNDDVMLEYRKIRASSLQATSDKASDSALKAIETLTAIMEDKTEKSSARVSAARCILDSFTRLYEIVDIDQRLTEIEKRQLYEK